MLKRSKRLNKALFDEVFKRGRTLSSPIFLAKVLKTTKTSRFSVSVSKKQASKAVERNKIRRRMYTALHSISLPTGLFIVFLPKKDILTLSLLEIRTEIEGILS